MVRELHHPEWFEPERTPGSLKFSYRESVTAPFELADGGYIEAYVKGRDRLG